MCGKDCFCQSFCYQSKFTKPPALAKHGFESMFVHICLTDPDLSRSPLSVVYRCIHPTHALLLEPIHVLCQWVACLVKKIIMAILFTSPYLLPSLKPSLMQWVATVATAHMQRARPTPAD